MSDAELLPQTPQDVIDALGFDPKDIDEAVECGAGAMTPGNTPNLTNWPTNKSLASWRITETVAAGEWAVVLESNGIQEGEELIV